MTLLKSYIDGRWVLPVSGKARMDVINPATEEVVAEIAICEADDVDLAVLAARRAFADFGLTTYAERKVLVQKLIAIFERRYDEMVKAITTEMGGSL